MNKQSGKNHETPIVGPDLAGSVLECGERNLKIEDSRTLHAEVGGYVASDPLGGVLRVPTLWGLPVVVSNSMPVGKFLVGNFMAAIIDDRMGAVIDLSESHDDFWVKNKVAIRAESRLSLAVLRRGAFRYGSL